MSKDIDIRSEWKGTGWYADAQRGGIVSFADASFDDTHISVEFVADYSTDSDEARRIARSIGLGTPRKVSRVEDL